MTEIVMEDKAGWSRSDYPCVLIRFFKDDAHFQKKKDEEFLCDWMPTNAEVVELLRKIFNNSQDNSDLKAQVRELIKE